jgi:hypothetical protein
MNIRKKNRKKFTFYAIFSAYLPLSIIASDRYSTPAATSR